MASYTPASFVKEIDGQVNRILRQVKPDEYNEKSRKAIVELKQNLTDARIYAHDYELSETREEQVDNAKQAKKWLEQARTYILKASEHNIFDAIDVAHLSAQIDQLKADLKWENELLLEWSGTARN